MLRHIHIVVLVIYEFRKPLVIAQKKGNSEWGEKLYQV